MIMAGWRVDLKFTFLKFVWPWWKVTCKVVQNISLRSIYLHALFRHAINTGRCGQLFYDKEQAHNIVDIPSYWNIDAYSQSDSEIIKQVLLDFVLTDRQLKSGDIPPTTIVVLDQPSHEINFDSTNYLRFERDYKKLEWDTFNDFIESNNSAFGLDTPDIKNLKIVMFKREDFKGWDSFIKSFLTIVLDYLSFRMLVLMGPKLKP
jgi:hypothetical protein